MLNKDGGKSLGIDSKTLKHSEAPRVIKTEINSIHKIVLEYEEEESNRKENRIR